MRTTQARQLRRFASHGAVAQVILNEHKDIMPFDITKEHIIAYHRMLRQLGKRIRKDEGPKRAHRRSKNRRKVVGDKQTVQISSKKK